MPKKARTMTEQMEDQKKAKSSSLFDKLVSAMRYNPLGEEISAAATERKRSIEESLGIVGSEKKKKKNGR